MPGEKTKAVGAAQTYSGTVGAQNPSFFFFRTEACERFERLSVHANDGVARFLNIHQAAWLRLTDTPAFPCGTREKNSHIEIVHS